MSAKEKEKKKKKRLIIFSDLVYSWTKMEYDGIWYEKAGKQVVEYEFVNSFGLGRIKF